MEWEEVGSENEMGNDQGQPTQENKKIPMEVVDLSEETKKQN